MTPASFQFLDPGPLIDDELELVAPDRQWMDDLLAALSHPLTLRDAPSEAKTTRRTILQFLKAAPGGRQPADPGRGLVPAYHFWMHLRDEFNPPLRIAGGIGLRIGQNRELELYCGHVGYHVYPPARGRHLAERACRLLLPLARRHGMSTLWITCNPENIASRRTCERLGAVLVEIIPIPADHEFYARGEREKCRYRLDLA